MIRPAARLIVRTHAPLRRWLTGAALVVLGALALYGSFEYGRYKAGFDRVAAGRQRRESEAATERLDRLNREQRLQLAELETIRVSQTRERAEVARTIGELQAQVARQEQELAFFRGVVAQGAPSAEIRIQQLRIMGTGDPRRYQLRLSLVQAVRPGSPVTGTVLVRIEGARDGAATTLDLAALTGGKRRELAVAFRYFSNLEFEVNLPAAFAAEQVSVEVRSSRRNVPPATRTFMWSVAAG